MWLCGKMTLKMQKEKIIKTIIKTITEKPRLHLLNDLKISSVKLFSFNKTPR